MRRPHDDQGRRGILLSLCIALVLTGCAVKLIADYDETIDQTTTEIQTLSLAPEEWLAAPLPPNATTPGHFPFGMGACRAMAAGEPSRAAPPLVSRALKSRGSASNSAPQRRSDAKFPIV
jgi:hypothetical protein